MVKKKTRQKRVLAYFFLLLLLISVVLGVVLYKSCIVGQDSRLVSILGWVGLLVLLLFDILCFAGVLGAIKSKRSARRRKNSAYSKIGNIEIDRTVAFTPDEGVPTTQRRPSAPKPKEPTTMAIPHADVSALPPLEKTEFVREKAPKQPKPPKAAKESKVVKQQIDLHIRPLDESAFKLTRNIITTASSIILGTREYQQDALYVSDSTFCGPDEAADAFAVVCDGMGGLADGDKASKTAVQVVRSLYAQARPVANVNTFFAEAVRRAQQEVSALSDANTGGPRAGTTFVSAIIQNNKLYTAAVGDSRIYIIRRAQIKMLTRDHNYYLLLKEQVQRGEITEEQMNNSPQKEALISYLGMPELKIVDIMASPIQLMDGDVVLLCSDGLTKALKKEEICNMVINNADQLQACAEMLTAAAQRKSPRGLDNTSVILLKYN